MKIKNLHIYILLSLLSLSMAQCNCGAHSQQPRKPQQGNGKRHAGDQGQQEEGSLKQTLPNQIAQAFLQQQLQEAQQILQVLAKYKEEARQVQAKLRTNEKEPQEHMQDIEAIGKMSIKA